jgi:hypothetical protein
MVGEPGEDVSCIRDRLPLFESSLERFVVRCQSTFGQSHGLFWKKEAALLGTTLSLGSFLSEWLGSTPWCQLPSPHSEPIPAPTLLISPPALSNEKIFFMHGHPESPNRRITAHSSYSAMIWTREPVQVPSNLTLFHGREHAPSQVFEGLVRNTRESDSQK